MYSVCKYTVFGSNCARWQKHWVKYLGRAEFKKLRQVEGIAVEKAPWLSTGQVEGVPTQHHSPAGEAGISRDGARMGA